MCVAGPLGALRGFEILVRADSRLRAIEGVPDIDSEPRDLSQGSRNVFQRQSAKISYRDSDDDRGAAGRRWRYRLTFRLHSFRGCFSMPHLALVSSTGLRVKEEAVLELGMTLPSLRRRAAAIQ